MQFIEELTLIYRVGVVAAVGLIALLLVISSRRRKAAASPSEQSEAPAVKVPKRRGRAKAEQAAPRRKRRKLAAEAAHAMGGESTPLVSDTSVPEVVVAPVAEAPVSEIAVAAPAPEPVPAPAAVTADDAMYLYDDPADDAGPFVAQPGWPSPGELASSFDPDAFDPLPELHEPEPIYDEAPMAQYDDTGAIELPAILTNEEDAALAEIEEWADTAQPVERWSDANSPQDDAWAIFEEESEVEAQVRPQAEQELAPVAAAPVDIEGIWSDPDEEPLWDQAPEAIQVAEIVATENDEPTFDIAPEAAFDLPEADLTDDVPAESFDVPLTAWDDDAPGAWDVSETPDTDVAAQIFEPRPSAPAGWGGAIGGPNSPVVLDLAGLAASGQSLDLLIEPSADGHGVRLRFGAAASQSLVETPVEQEEVVASADIAPEVEVAPEPEASEITESEDGYFEASWLAGVAPGEATQQVEQPATAEPAKVIEPVVVEAHEEIVAPQKPVEVHEPVVAADPAPTFPDRASSNGYDTDGHQHDAPEFAPEHAVQATASAVMDADDDPARILADIRARLAALDAQR